MLLPVVPLPVVEPVREPVEPAEPVEPVEPPVVVAPVPPAAAAFSRAVIAEASDSSSAVTAWASVHAFCDGPGSRSPTSFCSAAVQVDASIVPALGVIVRVYAVLGDPVTAKTYPAEVWVGAATVAAPAVTLDATGTVTLRCPAESVEALSVVAFGGDTAQGPSVATRFPRSAREVSLSRASRAFWSVVSFCWAAVTACCADPSPPEAPVAPLAAEVPPAGAVVVEGPVADVAASSRTPAASVEATGPAAPVPVTTELSEALGLVLVCPDWSSASFC